MVAISVPSTATSQLFDVLVIGGGAAGLYAALCLPDHYRVGLITKDTLALSASDWAQGGIAAAIAPDDSPVLHVEDTLKAGAGLCDVEAVNLLVEQAPQCVQSLVNMGVAFDRHGDSLALTLEAAHSRRRVLHAADTTGRAMVTTLQAHVLNRPNIRVLPQAFVLDLWVSCQGGDRQAEPRCRGVIVVQSNEIRWLTAKAVVLATGGGGQVFAQTTNPALSTGDGVAMAWRAGAQLRDLEFFQFHPTALTKPGAPRFLISEAVRGEGAHLIDAQGKRFAFDYHPAGELAPRDVVSRAIFNHLQQTTPDPTTAHVWLDLRPIAPETVRRRFPNIIHVCQTWGIDVLQEPIPVAPAAHYWMGGITTDTLSRTTLAGLYAVGETASTGVHGANRLASNSLLECLVFGAQLRSLELSDLPPDPISDADSDRDANKLERALEELAQIKYWRQELPRLMWQSAGICREHRSLNAAITQVETWKQELMALPLSQTLVHLLNSPNRAPLSLSSSTLSQSLRLWGETRNLLDVADLILKSAVLRTESRGGHYRSDYPAVDPKWQVHTLVEHQTWRRSRSV
ncbi:L-aspartate oxidase [Thermocoleostomius sinensis]|uniref:L-aspartate oxidase n=1 Tax=Thermocoleostomius sinensis TaxID=3065396 RepID=UPI0025B718A7|nr:L-aspartate oxidase [Thermocoleostomius sinensis]